MRTNFPLFWAKLIGLSELIGLIRLSGIFERFKMFERFKSFDRWTCYKVRSLTLVQIVRSFGCAELVRGKDKVKRFMGGS